MSKYHNVRCKLFGHHFDSKSEAARYWELMQLEKAGEIFGLSVHPKYKLSVCTYEGDMVYHDVRLGRVILEDVKSKPTRTATYKLKKKMMKAELGIDITEVTGVSEFAKAAVERAMAEVTTQTVEAA